jgi:hypothetical protein
MDDGIAEGQYFLSCCPTLVDEYESLLVMNSCSAKGFAFPTTLFYHPAGRNLGVIVWHIRIFAEQLF